MRSDVNFFKRSTLNSDAVGGYPRSIRFNRRPNGSISGICGGLCSLGLFVGYGQLPFHPLGGFNRISRSLLRLGIQNASLRLHLPELAIEHYEGNHAHDKKEGRKNDHPPVGIAKPIHGFLRILRGSAMDIFGVCGSSRLETGTAVANVSGSPALSLARFISSVSLSYRAPSRPHPWNMGEGQRYNT